MERELKELDAAECRSVSETIEFAKEQAKQSENGRISMQVLINGVAARGSTIARNALTTKNRDLA